MSTMPGVKRLTLGLMSLFFVLACGQRGTDDANAPPKSATPADVAKKLDPHRAELGNLLATMKELQTAAKAHPPLTPLTTVPTSATDVLTAEEESVAGGPRRKGCEIGQHPTWAIFQQLDKPYNPGDYELGKMDEQVKTMLAAKHALICRTVRLDPLVVDEKNHSFTGGGYEGECRMFDLATKAYEGGIPIRAHVSDELSYANYNISPDSFSTNMSSAISGELIRSLWKEQPPKDAFYYYCDFREPDAK
jgi:hypothetical protein